MLDITRFEHYTGNLPCSGASKHERGHPEHVIGRPGHAAWCTTQAKRATLGACSIQLNFSVQVHQRKRQPHASGMPPFALPAMLCMQQDSKHRHGSEPCLIILHLVNGPVHKPPEDLGTVVWVQQNVIPCPTVAQLQPVVLSSNTSQSLQCCSKPIRKPCAASILAGANLVHNCRSHDVGSIPQGRP